MQLSGKQRKQLQEALINAFPTSASLEQMFSFELDKNLRAIAGEGSLQDIVFKLIQTAESEGWVEDLVLAARNINPRNSELEAIAQQLFTNSQLEITASSNIPSDNINEDAIAEYRSKVEEFLADDGEICDIELNILNRLQRKLEISEEKARAVENEVKENFAEYKSIYTNLVCEQGYPLREESQNKLNQLQEALDLKDNTILIITELASQKGVDYTKLRNFLKAGQWKDADFETYRVMLKVVGREEGDGIRDEELLNFPSTDLHTIDRLWVKYSNERFGFSVQKKIYLEVGGVLEGEVNKEVWEKFGDAIGWRVKTSWIKYSDVIYDTKAPGGHLPFQDLSLRRGLVFFGILLSHPAL